MLDLFLLSIVDTLFTNCYIGGRGGSTYSALIRGLRLETSLTHDQTPSFEALCQSEKFVLECSGVVRVSAQDGENIRVPSRAQCAETEPAAAVAVVISAVRMA